MKTNKKESVTPVELAGQKLFEALQTFRNILESEYSNDTLGAKALIEECLSLEYGMETWWEFRRPGEVAT